MKKEKSMKKKDSFQDFFKPTKLKIALFLCLYSILLFASYYRIVESFYSQYFPNPIYALEPFIVLSELSVSVIGAEQYSSWNYGVVMWNSFLSAVIGILNLLYHYFLACLISSIIAGFRKK